MNVKFISRTIELVCFIAIFQLILSENACAQSLPSDEDVTGIMKLCAGGRLQRYEGEVLGKIEFWKKGVSGTGSASIVDLGALLSTIKTDPNSVKLYQQYVECIKGSIQSFLEKPNRTDKDGFVLNGSGSRVCQLEFLHTPNTCVAFPGVVCDNSIDKYFESCLMFNGAWVRVHEYSGMPVGRQ